MNIIKPSFSEIRNENPQKHIEEIARTCYKSTDLISEDSHKNFIKNIYNKKHWAMLEHFIFIYQLNNNYDFNIPIVDFFESQKYINITSIQINNEYRSVISFSARSLLDIIEKYSKINTDEARYFIRTINNLIERVIYDYDCYELFGNKYYGRLHDEYLNIRDITILTPTEQWAHGWKSIKFICDRGVSHEIVRHRDASFAQESTRYCNYSKDKFGNEITVIKPSYLRGGFDDLNKEMVAWGIWIRAIESSEKAYFEMLDVGCSPQEARAVLPNSLKTEIIMTARNYEWAHFFELRCDNAAHPQMRELAIPLFEYFNNDNIQLFNNDTITFKNLK